MNDTFETAMAVSNIRVNVWRQAKRLVATVGTSLVLAAMLFISPAIMPAGNDSSSLVGQLLKLNEPRTASANYAGQNIRRSASTASYNDGSITVYPLGYARRSESSLVLIRGASYRMSKYPENVAMLQVKFVGKRYREWDPSTGAYGSWHSMPKGYYLSPVYSRHDVTFQVDK